MITTAEQQLMLELINRARANPAGEFDQLILDANSGTTVAANITSAVTYFGVDLDAFADQLAGLPSVAPLAWNSALAQSADTHTDLMIAQDEQSHNLAGEASLLNRMLNAGYEDLRQVAENIYAYAEDPLYAHAGFYIDWGYDAVDISGGTLVSNWQSTGDGIQDNPGHRNSILSATYTEVGLSWTQDSDPSTEVGPFLTTQHFGTTWSYAPKLLGVVIDDADGDAFYDVGEGLGGVTVQAVGSAGTFTTTSWAAGGYQMALPDGVYTVTFSGGALLGEVTQSVTISGENAKLDARAQDAVILTGQTLTGGDTDDVLSGGLGNDTADAGRGNDLLDMGEGADNVWADGGDDTVYGGAGNDTIRGGRESDLLYGDAGDDSIVGQRNADTLHGGEGADTLKGGGGSDLMSGEAGDDFLKGGTYRDTVLGGDGNDTLVGNRHDDSLSGGAGADDLNGGGNNDTLIGGADDDTLKGGAGADVFVFDLDHGADVIRDFDLTEDRLALTYSLMGGQSVTDILGAASISATGVQIDFGAGDTILFEGLSGTIGLDGAIDLI
ncbi:CAP domain-containing protein [Tropicibacter naphthalenivorans]|uniref:Hemolysin, plasmid n=1 Tax=Tropicibacter naphthalenivorans TaxID=441103 RepID=A0A0P1GK99_9RHOB|nr:CAP domain-containing protein [Tropicibacter naphthalenivorans]CUH82626.1 Hemolysin, plasmid [Tropicibacter naphthalenivorans]SMD08951.1 Hemolysin-type calcium-binding repeat-containing protein [Tropicibacter naphthalenivorans]